MIRVARIGIRAQICEKCMLQLHQCFEFPKDLQWRGVVADTGQQLEVFGDGYADCRGIVSTDEESGAEIDQMFKILEWL